jgi:hypothetical protein
MELLRSVYGSLADPQGVRLYGTPAGLVELAALFRRDSPTRRALGLPPAAEVEVLALRSISFAPTADGPILFAAEGDELEISGGQDARAKLAGTLWNLAGDSQPASGVQRHVDLEYFPEHPFLSARGLWMTVYLVSR